MTDGHLFNNISLGGRGGTVSLSPSTQSDDSFWGFVFRFIFILSFLNAI